MTGPADRDPSAGADAEPCVERFSDEARRAIYDVMALRRDVRQFRTDGGVDDATLDRILSAAHLAPSVGFSQPWGFVVVRELERRARVRESFLRCREAESVRFPPERRDKYLSYRLEGIVESALNVCVAVDLRSRGEAILGTTAQPEAVRASVCCAVQNLWLAARSEGVGVGWVSIVETSVLREELALPAGVEPIAYLCVGRPVAFKARPMLEETGWRPRRSLAEVVFRERWADGDPGSPAPPAVPNTPWAAGAVDTGKARVAAHRSAGSGRGGGGGALADAVVPRASGSFDEAAHAAARAHGDELAKPKGSLGRLEDVAAWYAGVVGRFPCPPPETAAVAVFAADHGVVREAVSAYPSQLTAATVCNVMAGGAAINVLARRYRVDLVLVDVGVAGDLSGAPLMPEVPLWGARIRAATGNIRREPAMTREEALAAMAVGSTTADACAARGASIVGTGEIGIGNTTSGAAIACAMLGASPDEVVGRGTGVGDATLARKIAVVRDALDLHRASLGDPVAVLAALGGLELAAIVGFTLRAAELRVPVVIDGFLAGACALVARAIRPEITRSLVASHASAERGSGRILEALGLSPLLALGMRLGEGTGAVLGIDLVRSAVALQTQMATFATAGVRRAPR
jgi:nicotinate-nucleotide--dimethylbenzimidazole phosphoribosyltransferase